MITSSPRLILRPISLGRSIPILMSTIFVLAMIHPGFCQVPLDPQDWDNAMGTIAEHQEQFLELESPEHLRVASPLRSGVPEGPREASSRISSPRENLLLDFQAQWSKALKEALKGKNLVVAIFMVDTSSRRVVDDGDPWLASHMEAQAKRVAREALPKALADTLSQIPILHKIQRFGKRISSAEIRVSDGKMDFKGLSLSDQGKGPDPIHRSTSSPEFRSRLKVTGGTDFGFSWSTTYGSLEHRLTYYLTRGDALEVDLTHRIHSKASFGLSYRMGSDQDRIAGKINIALY